MLNMQIMKGRLAVTAIKFSDPRRAGEIRAAQVFDRLAARVSPALQFCILQPMAVTVAICFALPVLIAATFSVTANAATRQDPKTELKPVGRLFSTSKERVLLDRIRVYAKPGDVVVVTDVEVVPNMPTLPDMPIATPPPQFTLNGYVKRSSGKETTWVNQVAHNESTTLERLKGHQELSKSPKVVVKLPNGQRLRLNLKVGQTFDAETGKTRDVYERKVKAKKPEPAADSGPASNPTIRPIE